MFGSADFKSIQKAHKFKMAQEKVAPTAPVDPDTLPASPGDLETLQELEELSFQMKAKESLVNIEEHNMKVYERTMREGRGL